MTIKLGILASGNGTNAQAMIDAVEAGRLDADIRIILSNRPHAGVLERAQRHGVPHGCIDHTAFSDRGSCDGRIVDELLAAGADTVALAGYMRMVTPAFLNAFPQRVLNIHPTLLPAFPGTDAVRHVVEYGVRFSGCTVHFVSDVMDGGPVIIQAVLPVRQEEDEDMLLDRIHVFEHRIYIQALQWLAEDRLRLDGRKVYLEPADRPLSPQPELALVWPPLEQGF